MHGVGIQKDGNLFDNRSATSYTSKVQMMLLTTFAEKVLLGLYI